MNLGLMSMNFTYQSYLRLSNYIFVKIDETSLDKFRPVMYYPDSIITEIDKKKLCENFLNINSLLFSTCLTNQGLSLILMLSGKKFSTAVFPNIFSSAKFQKFTKEEVL